MSWKIEFHHKAEEEFEGLPESLFEKLDALFIKIRQNGFLNLPRDSVRHIGDGIRELRVMGKNGIARSLYVTESEQRIVVLVVFVKKTEKTPQEIIKIAKTRRDEMQ